jgi:hypothetical protein
MVTADAGHRTPRISLLPIPFRVAEGSPSAQARRISADAM